MGIMQWICRLGLLLTVSGANVVSTHGAQTMTEMEVTSSGEVVRTSSSSQQPAATAASKTVDKPAFSADFTAKPNKEPAATEPVKTARVQQKTLKAPAFGFDTIQEDRDVAEGKYSYVEAQTTKKQTTISLPSLTGPQPYHSVLKNEGNGSFYTINMCFGTPGTAPNGSSFSEQCLPGIPDTGSFEIVVRSKQCKSCSAPQFDSNQSDSFCVTTTDEALPASPPCHKHKSLAYGSGPVQTKWAYDVVKAQGSAEGFSHLLSVVWNGLTNSHVVEGLSAANMPFLEVTQSPIQGLSHGSEMCGIYGIGRGDVDGRPERYIRKAGVPRYSICLPADQNKDGEMIWSSPDVSSNPAYRKINVIGSQHWAVRLTHMNLHGNRHHADLIPTPTNMMPANHVACAILDSGTTLIAPTTDMFAMLNTAIMSHPLDCNDISQMPTLKFKLDGKDFSLPPSAYVARFDSLATETNDLKMFKNIKNLMHVDVAAGCMLLLTAPMDMSEPTTANTCPMMILGMPFFRYYKTVFDWNGMSDIQTSSGNNHTQEGVVYTTEHSECNENVNSWDTTASNYMAPAGYSASAPTSAKVAMKIDITKIRFPKDAKHYAQFGHKL